LTNNVTVTPPTGAGTWTELTATTFVASHGFVRWFWKRLTGADSGTWNFTFSGADGGGQTWSGLWSGRDTSATPLDFTTQGQDTTVTQPAALTGTATTGSDLVYGLSHFNSQTVNTAAGFTNRIADSNGESLFTADNTTSGSKSAQAAVGSSDWWWTTFASIKVPAPAAARSPIIVPSTAIIRAATR
jgi:hypothetical protein